MYYIDNQSDVVRPLHTTCFKLKLSQYHIRFLATTTSFRPSLSKLAVATAADALGGTANRRSKEDSRLCSSGTRSRVEPSPSSRYGSLIWGHDSILSIIQDVSILYYYYNFF